MLMKKMFFAAAVAALAFAVNASAQFSVGVGYANEKEINKTVVNLPDGYKGSARLEAPGLKLDGFYVEASYNWEFTNMGASAFALQPGLRYTMLTSSNSVIKAKVSKDNDKLSYLDKSRYSNHLLEMPINVKYSYEFVPDALKAYVFAGPVLSFGLAANSVEVYKNEYTLNGEPGKEYSRSKMNYYNGKYSSKEYNSETKKYDTNKGTDSDYKLYNAFDIKFGIGAGVTVCEKLDIKFGYNFGLLNRSAVKEVEYQGYEAKSSTHSNIMYFGVAYNF